MPTSAPSVEMVPRVWFNPELRSANYTVPGVFGLIIMIITTVWTSQSIVREREVGTLEQLVVTPVRPLELLLGKSLPYAVTAFIAAGEIVILARVWFHVPIQGSIPLLFALALARAAEGLAGEGSEAPYALLGERLQALLGRQALLACIWLFQREEEPCPTVPVALAHLRFQADYLEMSDRRAVVERLQAFGHDPAQFEGIPDPWLTQLLRKELADRLPDPERPESGELSAALARLIELRARPSVSLAEVEGAVPPLLAYVEDLLSVVGRGYLGLDRSPMEGIEDEQRRLAEALSRLAGPQG